MEEAGGIWCGGRKIIHIGEEEDLGTHKYEWGRVREEQDGAGWSSGAGSWMEREARWLFAQDLAGSSSLGSV